MRVNNNSYLGKQVGSYQLVDCLGKGGFADVYLGEHIYLKTQSAIKMLHIQLSKRAIHNFLNEAKIIARLEHPNIIRVFDYGVQDGSPFLVMSYAPNGTLRQRYPRGTSLPLEQVIQYTQQTALALDYAHQLQLIHRDVKPANMLIGQQRQLLLSDFGLALAVSDSDSQSEISSTDPSSSSSSHSESGDVDSSSGSRPEISTAGTIRYMAPEQIQGKACYASDQYALGIIAYEWICGECPFTGSFMKIASQHVLATPPSLNDKVPNLPAGVEQVIFKALAKEPEQRFASVSDFAQALQQACQTIAPIDILTQKNTGTPLNGGKTSPNTSDTLKKNQHAISLEKDNSKKSSQKDTALNSYIRYNATMNETPSTPSAYTSHLPSDTDTDIDTTYTTLKLPLEADITYHTSKISSLSDFTSTISDLPQDTPNDNIKTDKQKDTGTQLIANRTPDTQDTSNISTKELLRSSSDKSRKKKMVFSVRSIALIVLLIICIAVGAIWYSTIHINRSQGLSLQKSTVTYKKTQQAFHSTQKVLPTGTTPAETTTVPINVGQTLATPISTTGTGITTNPPIVSSTPGVTPLPVIVPTPTPIPDCIQGSLSYIRFTSRANPVIPRSRALVLTNCGGSGSQNWQGSVQSDAGWLSLNINNGSLIAGTSSSVQVLTDATNLTANTYNGSIVFTAGSASFTVTVVYVVV